MAAGPPDAADSAERKSREATVTIFWRRSFLKRHSRGFNLFANGFPSNSRKRWTSRFSSHWQGQPACLSCESRSAASLINCNSSSESSIAPSCPGERKGHQRKAEQIDMAATTGRENNCFGMPVNHSADVHASGRNDRNLRAAHTVDGDVARRTLVNVRNMEQGCSVREV